MADAPLKTNRNGSRASFGARKGLDAQMPYFSVILNGEGISLPSVDSGEEIVGFYTTRWVEAQNVEQAKEAAAHLVRDDWTVGEYASVNRGNPPRIFVDRIWEISRWKYWLGRKPSGHTFYPHD